MSRKVAKMRAAMATSKEAVPRSVASSRLAITAPASVPAVRSTARLLIAGDDRRADGGDAGDADGVAEDRRARVEMRAQGGDDDAARPAVGKGQAQQIGQAVASPEEQMQRLVGALEMAQR